jgi:hypothetical protein
MGTSVEHRTILDRTLKFWPKSLGYCEPKHHKPWFDEECSKLFDGRKQAKLRWLQTPSEANENNLSGVRREVSRHFRNKKREYLEDKINELESNSKNKNMRDKEEGINEFKKGYRPRSKLVKTGGATYLWILIKF